MRAATEVTAKQLAKTRDTSKGMSDCYILCSSCQPLTHANKLVCNPMVVLRVLLATQSSHSSIIFAWAAAILAATLALRCSSEILRLRACSVPSEAFMVSPSCV